MSDSSTTFPVHAQGAYPEQSTTHTQHASGFVPSTDPRPQIPEPGESDPRVERNRQNAQHSTGPRTAEGKATSSRNAFKHGLSIQRHVILRGEDPAAYQRLLTDLREIYEPLSRREDLAVEDIAQCRWAFQRFDLAEATALRRQTSTYTDDPEHPCSVGEALGYCAVTDYERDRDGNKHVEPDTDFPTFEKIQRYRGHWDRRHQRALAEFDRAQRSRQNQLRADYRHNEECRKQELHEIRRQLMLEKLEQQRHKAAKSAEQSKAERIDALLDEFLNAPPPDLDEELLGQLGFVPQTDPKSPSTDPAMQRHPASDPGFVPSAGHRPLAAAPPAPRH